MSTALEKLAMLAPTPPKPVFERPDLPSDITEYSSEQLAETFTKLTAWADYVASELAKAQITERKYQKQLEFLENTALVSRMGSAAKGERITLLKAQISLDPEIVELSNSYEESYAYRKLVETLLSNHERDLALVSREITRRTNDQRAMRKDYGI